MAPLALLLGVLVELALLSKRNELVAIMGAGISLYRIAVPIVVLGVGLSGLLFWLDHTYLPYAPPPRLSGRGAAGDPQAGTWVFSSGWDRSFGLDNSVSFRPLANASFPELTEGPTGSEEHTPEHQ